MKFSFTKLRAAFGDIKAMETLHVDTYTETIINDVEGNPFGISEMNVLYAGLSELAGYHYIKTIIIGTCQIKTFKGAKLMISGLDFDLELQSDMEELESEYSNVSKRYITRIDFEINSEDVSKISRATVESLELVAKKTHIKFSIVEGDDADLVEKHSEPMDAKNEEEE